MTTTDLTLSERELGPIGREYVSVWDRKDRARGVAQIERRARALIDAITRKGISRNELMDILRKDIALYSKGSDHYDPVERDLAGAVLELVEAGAV